MIDQMNTALEVENQLLTLLQEGGTFSEQVLTFIENHGQEKPSLDHFPANIAHLREKFEQTRKELQSEKLSRLKKLRDGSQKLAEGVRRIRHEGAEEMKRQLVKKSDPLLRKLAVLQQAKQMAADYNRFTGVKPEEESGPPSAVQFIMKTPGRVVP